MPDASDALDEIVHWVKMVGRKIYCTTVDPTGSIYKLNNRGPRIGYSIGNADFISFTVANRNRERSTSKIRKETLESSASMGSIFKVCASV